MKTTLFKGADGRNYLLPFMLIASLFFLWGFAHSLLDVLNKHFQDALSLSKAQSGLVQAAAYGAYFVMALPAGFVARRFGYKAGIVTGLSLFAAGALWFVPAVGIGAFWAFLLGLLVLFGGLTFLETVANPYTTLLGSPEGAARRINLAQTFNALGWIGGPLVGSLLVFHNKSGQSAAALLADAIEQLFSFSAVAAQESGRAVAANASVQSELMGNAVLIPPYVGLAALVIVVLVMFLCVKLPEIQTESLAPSKEEGQNEHLREMAGGFPLHFRLAVVAQFLYVAAQTGIGSFFVNYTIETPALHLTERQAGLLLGLGGMTLFAAGRFAGSFLMKKIKPEILLGAFALVCTVLMTVVATSHTRLGVLALISCYLFMSIMFPSIFALGVKGLGNRTKIASSILVLTIVGGAIAPSLMGLLGEENMSIGFIVPLVCFAFISFFGFSYKIKK